MAKLSANTIFQWVKDEIFNLWSKGEISIPITDGLTKDDCLVAYWQNEGEITVEFNGEKRTVPCNIKSKNVDYVARCIMHGFAQIYLNKNESINKNMNRKTVRLTESDLHRIIKESVKKVMAEGKNELNEAEDGGWVVETSEAQEAYNLAVQEMGEETINAAIVRSLGDETLAKCLAYIFRQYDFREWSDRF